MKKRRITIRMTPKEVEWLRTLAKREGIICALESAHAIAAVIRHAPSLPRKTVIVVNLSGRGDKDMGTLAARMGDGGAATGGASRTRLSAAGRGGGTPR